MASKPERALIKIEPQTRDRLKVACAQSKETYSQWISRQLDKTENQNKKK